MANEEQLAILKQGVDVWNQWREENPNIKIDLTKVHLVAQDFTMINFENADLEGSNFQKTELVKTNLRGTNLTNVDFRYTRLWGSDLSRANLTNADFNSANLNGSILNNANLSKAKFINAGFFDADLRNAYLIGADFLSANLGRADFRKAKFNDTSFNHANLEKADLSATALSGTTFRWTLLDNTIIVDADFCESIFGATKFLNCDLSKSYGLEASIHVEPSSISTDTFHKSKGKIPVEFLRGCGLSDLDIAYAKLAAPGLDSEEVSQIIYRIHHIYLDQPIQFYSCFISYNNKDEEFAQRLHDDLQDSGMRCWFAPEDIKIGDRIRPTIDTQIRMREKLIVILSENSIQSEWVGDEVEAAIEQENANGKDVLFPIRLDEAALNTRSDWAAKIKRRRSIGDFSQWKDDAEYQKMFKKLLKDLRASEK